MINMNFTNNEMCDMILMYGECGRRPREAARTYACRYPQREQPHYTFFMRLKSGLRKNGQFRPKLAITYLFIKISDNTILNFFYHYFHISYKAITVHKYRTNTKNGYKRSNQYTMHQYTNRSAVLSKELVRLRYVKL